MKEIELEMLDKLSDQIIEISKLYKDKIDPQGLINTLISEAIKIAYSCAPSEIEAILYVSKVTNIILNCYHKDNAFQKLEKQELE